MPRVPDGPGPRPRFDWRGAVVPLAVGLLFLLLYVGAYRYLPRGPGEFGYLPAMGPLPFAPIRGFTFEQLALHLLRMALLGPALVGLGLALRGLPPLPVLLPRRAVLAVGGLSILLGAVFLSQVLRGRALVDDELTYRQQAVLYAGGRLAETTVPPWGNEAFTIYTRRGATGKYLPGEPLLQVPGTWLGLPGLLHLPLAALALAVWHAILRRRAGAAVAGWGTALVALSPLFIVNNGTGLSHTTSLACVVIAGLGYEWAREGRALTGALVAGTAVGFGLTVRPQVLLPVGAVILGALAWELGRRRRWDALAGLVAAGGVWLAFIAGYDAWLSGSWRTLPWFLYQPLERFGFGQVTDAPLPVHTPAAGLAHLLVSLVRFNGWWLGWPWSLGLLVVWGLVGRPRAGAALWLAAGLALGALNFLYYSPGVSDTGPVYYFEWLLPASILGGHAIATALARWPRAATGLLAAHLVLGTGSFLVEQGARLGRLAEAIHGRAERAMATIEPPALLLYEVHPSESLHPGWVFSFPVRYRDDADPVVTYPRSSPAIVAPLRERYAGRACWYYRIDPATLRVELQRCEQAAALLARPLPLPGQRLWIRPTAARLGYWDAQPPIAGVWP